MESNADNNKYAKCTKVEDDANVLNADMSQMGVPWYYNEPSSIIKVKYHDNEIAKLAKIPQGDWIDLRAAETVTMNPGEFKLISLGVSMKLPLGYEAHVVPRSSTFKQWGIIQTNSMGVIDNSYSGTNDVWMFPAYATRFCHIRKGDRICQFRIMPKQPSIVFDFVEDLDAMDRGGLGSTGVN